MIEILIIVAGIIGVIVAVYLLTPDTRNRGVRDTARVQRVSEEAEREMDYRRDRVADRERRRPQSRRRF